MPVAASRETRNNSTSTYCPTVCDEVVLLLTWRRHAAHFSAGTNGTPCVHSQFDTREIEDDDGSAHVLARSRRPRLDCVLLLLLMTMMAMEDERWRMTRRMETASRVLVRRTCSGVTSELCMHGHVCCATRLCEEASDVQAFTISSVDFIRQPCSEFA